MDYQDKWRYEIRVNGKLSKSWTEWLGATKNFYDDQDKETMLVVEIADQSALYGLLNKIRDLGLCLISLYRLD